MALDPVILSCAVTGAVHTPSMSPHLPVTAAQIATAAIEAAAAGAAIVHLHARDPDTGAPDQSVERFAPILAQIQASGCEAVLNLTTGGAPTMTLQQRLAPALHFAPELVSLNMGSMNFGLYPMLQRFTQFEHAWEQPYLEGSRDRVFRNTFADIEHILRSCGAQGTRFEFECYDLGHLYTLAHFADRGLVQAPFFVQSVFGILGGIGAHADDVLAMRRTADRLFGDRYHWSVLGAGRHQMEIAQQSVALGGHVRVGLEDSLWLGAGRLATRNAQQVEGVRSAIEAQGRRIATPAEARALLGLKGAAGL